MYLVFTALAIMLFGLLFALCAQPFPFPCCFLHQPARGTSLAILAMLAMFAIYAMFAMFACLYDWLYFAYVSFLSLSLLPSCLLLSLLYILFHAFHNTLLPFMPIRTVFLSSLLLDNDEAKLQYSPKYALIGSLFSLQW